jgi:2-amino-4-hydroxy-6-hydroxymethyldihydropteridine diphosphokinase
MMPQAPVLLGLGGNVGDREANLAQARRALGERGFRITAESALYETEPVGGPPQGPFLNQVVGGETALAPDALLRVCLAVEQALGRMRREANGPRTLDIDMLFYGDAVRQGPGLVLPHPRLAERRFVLVPLVEIAPLLRHPVLGLTASELLARCPDASRVERVRAALPRA